jgi:hypothetical protein
MLFVPTPNILSQVQTFICAVLYMASDLPLSHDQELVLDDLLQIWTQSALEEAEEHEP